MRLPLGILSGMGFIGGGVILKRENLVLGVTTAATLWFVTVLGLCFGGGQLALGSIALVIGFIVLRFLKTIELKIKTVRRGTLSSRRRRMDRPRAMCETSSLAMTSISSMPARRTTRPRNEARVDLRGPVAGVAP